jgi:hypothetical protein
VSTAKLSVAFQHKNYVTLTATQRVGSFFTNAGTLRSSNDEETTNITLKRQIRVGEIDGRNLVISCNKTSSTIIIIIIIIISTARQPIVVQGVLIIDVSRLHSDTPHSVGLLWMSDQPDKETFTWQHTHHYKETTIPPRGFEPTVLASKPPQAYAFDWMATVIGNNNNNKITMMSSTRYPVSQFLGAS